MAQHDTLVLGRRIRAARRRLGLTLAELGEVVGRPAPYLSQLENGKVEPKFGLINVYWYSLPTKLGAVRFCHESQIARIMSQ